MTMLAKLKSIVDAYATEYGLENCHVITMYELLAGYEHGLSSYEEAFEVIENEEFSAWCDTLGEPDPDADEVNWYEASQEIWD